MAIIALPASAQTVAEAAESAAQLDARAKESVETLRPLLKARADVQTEIDALVTRINAASDTEKPELTEALTKSKGELASIEDQISVLATGISETEYNRRDPALFDLKSELETLVQPFIVMMRNATEEARQIEATRRLLADAEDRMATAKQAIATLAAVQAQANGPALTADLDRRAALWSRRVETAANSVATLRQQLDDLLSRRVSAGSQVESAAKGFFRERGLSLLMGIGAFVGVLMSLRILGRLAGRLARRRGLPRSFQTRLANLVYTVFTLAASFAALLIVFNQRNDWLLLGLSAVMMLALVWITIRMLPGLVEQMTILLNLGAVQENERVIFQGVPFTVQRLDFYTDLVNPALDGGEFTLPVRELVGLHSRPAAEDEAWFPSNKGDWVRLSDGRAGQVIAQTPEMVVIEQLGGARATYQTADYLAQTPENLSDGYRVEVEFGIGYAHQADATGPIMQTMLDRVTEAMTDFVGPEHIVGFGVDFLRAGASSLDFEVEVDVRGSAADRFDDIERELARVLVAIATEHGWDIPFQQIVLHQAPAAR